MQIIDAHTHAFPDALAERAVPVLASEGRVPAHLDGKVASLLASMDRAGIAASVICSIATRPEQFGAILKWSRAIASDRLIPLASVHPSDPEAAAKVRLVRQAGLRALKLHPYYQDYDLDEERLFPLYAAIEEEGLVLVSHAGFDVAFPRIRKADPVRLMKVLRLFPRLRIVASHLGGWQDWDAVRHYILGKPIYLELSFSLEYLPAEEVRAMILAHPAEYVLFGTDSPWGNQSEVLAKVRALNLGEDRLARLLGLNAEALFGAAAR